MTGLWILVLVLIMEDTFLATQTTKTISSFLSWIGSYLMVQRDGVWLPLCTRKSPRRRLRAEDDLKKNGVKKLFNNSKKPTGRTGQDIKDQVE